MAARCLDPERPRNPARAGPEAVADLPGGPVLEREEARAAAPEIERYLGNAYLQALAERAAGTPAPAAAGPGRDRDPASDGARAPLATPLQTKLAVGAAGDAFEREADRVADALMRRAAARASRAGRRGIAGGRRSGARGAADALRRRQRDGCGSGGCRAGGADAPGRLPLAGALSGHFSNRCWASISAPFAIHTGVAAIQTARALNARAYAIGSDIAFGSGQYRPEPTSGRRLLAHELVHTVQQQGGLACCAATGPLQGSRPHPQGPRPSSKSNPSCRQRSL